MVSPRFDEKLDKEIYGKDCVAARFGRIKLSHFDDVFALLHDPIANLRHFSFRKAPHCCYFSEISSTWQGKRVLPRPF